TIAVALDRAIDVCDPVAAALNLPVVADSEVTAAERVDEICALLGLDASRDKFVHELSTGTRRIVDLACVIASQPKVLLLDVRYELDASMIVIEHVLALLQAVATRVVALDLGSVIADGPTDAVLHDPRVVQAYLGDTVG